MARKRKKRYVKATVNRREEVFEFNIEEVDDKSLVAAALGVRPGQVSNVTSSTTTPLWFKKAASTKNHNVDLQVRP